MTAAQPNAIAAPDQYTAQLPCTPDSVSRGRALVSTVLAKWGMREELTGAGGVIVSELLTNVVNHTSTDLTTVAIHRGRSRVRIEVADASPAAPCIRGAGGSAECGRGLLLIDGLSSHWGYVKYPWGKVIWAELCSCEKSQR
ncbi:ATP-binding protein [Streptomyces sp. NPDC054855]